MIGTRAAAILGTAALLCTGLYLYFTPYQQCVREMQARGSTENAAAVCLRSMR